MSTEDKIARIDGREALAKLRAWVVPVGTFSIPLSALLVEIDALAAAPSPPPVPTDDGEQPSGHPLACGCVDCVDYRERAAETLNGAIETVKAAGLLVVKAHEYSLPTDGPAPAPPVPEGETRGVIERLLAQALAISIPSRMPEDVREDLKRRGLLSQDRDGYSVPKAGRDAVDDALRYLRQPPAPSEGEEAEGHDYDLSRGIDLRLILAARCNQCTPQDEATHGICPKCPNGPGSGRADTSQGAAECEWCGGDGVTCSTTEPAAPVVDRDERWAALRAWVETWMKESQRESTVSGEYFVGGADAYHAVLLALDPAPVPEGTAHPEGPTTGRED